MLRHMTSTTNTKCVIAINIQLSLFFTLLSGKRSYPVTFYSASDKLEVQPVLSFFLPDVLFNPTDIIWR